MFSYKKQLAPGPLLDGLPSQAKATRWQRKSYCWWFPDVSMVEPLHITWYGMLQLTSADISWELLGTGMICGSKREPAQIGEQCRRLLGDNECHAMSQHVSSQILPIGILDAIHGFDSKFQTVARHFNNTCTPNRFALHALKTDVRAYFMTRHVPRPKR